MNNHVSVPETFVWLGALSMMSVVWMVALASGLTIVSQYHAEPPNPPMVLETECYQFSTVGEDNIIRRAEFSKEEAVRFANELRDLMEGALPETVYKRLAALEEAAGIEVEK